MKRKFATLLAVAALVGISAAHVPQASAANINTMLTGCRSDSDIQPTVTTAGLLNQTKAAIQVLCPVPRSPIANGASVGLFFADGINPPNQTSSCVLLVFNFDGFFEAEVSAITTNAGPFDFNINAPDTQLPTFAYTQVSCRIPPGGRLLGVTSVQ